MLLVKLVIHHFQMGTTGGMEKLEMLCERHSSHSWATAKKQQANSSRCSASNTNFKAAKKSGCTREGFLLVCFKESHLSHIYRSEETVEIRQEK